MSDNHDSGDRCMPDFNVQPQGADPNWKPLYAAPDQFAVKIMVASQVNDSKNTAAAVMRTQEYLADYFKEEMFDSKLLMNIETYQDGCVHSTGWSPEPKSITSKSVKWHCHQSATRVMEGLQQLQKDSAKPNVVILVGNRFDDDLEKTKTIISELNEENETRFFTIPTHTSKELQKQYLELAEAGEGISLSHIELGDSLENVLKEITQLALANVLDYDLEELPAAHNENVRKLLQKTFE